MGNMNLPIGVDDTAPSDVVGQARAGALPGRSAMKYSIVTAGVCAAFVGTDAFVPSVPAIGSLRAPPAVASMQSVQPVRDTEMTMALGGSKSRQVPKSDSSRLSNIFRGSRGKGSSNGNGGFGNRGGNKLPPLGSSSASSSDDGDKKKSSSNPLGFIWAAYLSLLETQPLLAKSLTSMTGFALGDLLAQKGVEKKDELDMRRLISLASFGALVHGSTGHFFYNFLDSQIPGTAAITVAKKVFIDQVIWNPIFGCLFFGYMGAVDGLGPSAIGKKIQNNLWTAVKGSWTVWPVAHAINFRFIPTSQRLLYINTVQVFYNSFLSIISQKE